MAGFRLAGARGTGITSELIQPGDVMLGGESYSAGAVATAGGDTLSGAAIATGIIERTGGGGGAFTDTSDTSANIITALAGGSSADVVAGSTFRLTYVNGTGQAMTLAAGAGVALGSGTTTTAASKINEYLVTVLNASPQVAVNSTFLITSKIITFVLPPNMSALPIGPNPPAYNITPGMSVTGTGIAAASKVLGITMGQGGITGVTLDTNTSAASAAGGNVVTFLPSVKIDSLYTATQ